MRTITRCRTPIAGLALVLGGLSLSGCDYAFSDVATRIRYALLRQLPSASTAGKTTTVSLRPDHWPDGCRGSGGYRLTISPYRGGKQVETGDIVVACRGGGSYATGLGSEAIALAGDLSIEKGRDEDLVITVRGTGRGIEIVTVQ